jgi:hypothetical protein
MVDATPKKAFTFVENRLDDELYEICITLKARVKIFLANPGCSDEETGTAFKTIRPYTHRALTICRVNKPIWE